MEINKIEKMVVNKTAKINKDIFPVYKTSDIINYYKYIFNEILTMYDKVIKEVLNMNIIHQVFIVKNVIIQKLKY